jgi:hypothetical protein
MRDVEFGMGNNRLARSRRRGAGRLISAVQIGLCFRRRWVRTAVEFIQMVNPPSRLRPTLPCFRLVLISGSYSFTPAKDATSYLSQSCFW